MSGNRSGACARVVARASTPRMLFSPQIWNHTFFWESMKPNGGGAPSGALAEAITRDFGSIDKFKDEFKTAGLTQFGSGW